MDKSTIVDFVAYQINWLESHDDIILDPDTEELIIGFLKGTGKCFIDETPDEKIIALTEKQAGQICDKYCRFPYTVEGAYLEAICEKCPLSEGDNEEQSDN